MEGLGGELTVNELKLKGELVEAYKTIAEKEAEVQRLREEIAVLKKKLLQSGGNSDDIEPEVEPSPILERKAEEIIPKECWGLVFRNLDAEDLVSCLEVCKTFKQLLDLQEFKVKWTFHLILPRLFSYLTTSDPDSDGDPSWKHLYNTRLVCQSWRHSIDKHAVKVQEGTQSSQRFYPRASVMPLLTRFKTSEDIEKFQEMFGEYQANPFPSRFVYIGTEEPVDDDEDYEEDNNAQKRLQDAYVKKVGKLLKRFGKHISRLWLCFNYEQIWGPNPLTLYKLMLTITIHLPNLKELLIQNDSDDNVKEVASYIAENALAELPKLQVLRICGLDKKTEGYLVNTFGPQLTQFERYFSRSPLTLSQIQMQRLKNVRKLSLALLEPKDTLELLGLFQSSLEHLKLTYKFSSAYDTWNPDEHLRNLKHLSIESLEIQLLIWGHVRVAEAGINIEEYNNATIKTLIIHFQWHDDREYAEISFNFLQALTKLENLEIKFSGEKYWTTNPVELPEVVKLNKYLYELPYGGGGSERIYHSNVWKKVPSLKTLRLDFPQDRYDNEEDKFVSTIFTREKYEKIKIIPEGDSSEEED